MSFIDSTYEEQGITRATLDDLEKALRHFGYKVTRTSMQISATYGGSIVTNGQISSISIVDKGDVRVLHDHESARGYMGTPNRGVTAKIIDYAEKYPVGVDNTQTIVSQGLTEACTLHRAPVPSGHFPARHYDFLP